MAARSESQFELLRADIAAVRAEMRDELREMRTEVATLREDMHAENARMRRDVLHVAIAMFGVFAAMYATTLAHVLS